MSAMMEQVVKGTLMVTDAKIDRNTYSFVAPTQGLNLECQFWRS